jgi:negative regulator of sigma-B (phosphoserine phosphatase)
MSSGRRTSRPPPRNELDVSTWSSGRVATAWVSVPRAGESVSGDAVVVREMAADTVLVAVLDALGHGPKAHEVAVRGVAYLHEAPAVENVLALVEGLHEVLKGSRGAAMLALLLSQRGLQACSVGNVDLRCHSAKLPFVLTPGVLGVRLRAPRLCSMPALAEERLVLYSDGISSRFDLRASRTTAPAELARAIFTSNRHAHDDASIVVVVVA